MSTDEVNAKFANQAEPVLGPGRAAELLDLTWPFDELADLGEFFAALLVPDRPGTG
jgi:hypothetical protein